MKDKLTCRLFLKYNVYSFKMIIHFYSYVSLTLNFIYLFFQLVQVNSLGFVLFPCYLLFPTFTVNGVFLISSVRSFVCMSHSICAFSVIINFTVNFAKKRTWHLLNTYLKWLIKRYNLLTFFYLFWRWINKHSHHVSGTNSFNKSIRICF